jgi:hypothetical protein
VARERQHGGQPTAPVLRSALPPRGTAGSGSASYFQQVKSRLGGKLALLSMARKPARRCHHTLRNLDDQVLAPAA